MNDSTDGHIVHAFNDELFDLNQLVLKQGALGRDQLQRAVQTLKDEDPRAAGHVMDGYREMNGLDVKADEEIIRIIAKRQPVAKDLRDSMVVQKTLGDLERVGDVARKVANLTIHSFDVDKNALGIAPNVHFPDGRRPLRGSCASAWLPPHTAHWVSCWLERPGSCSLAVDRESYGEPGPRNV